MQTSDLIALVNTLAACQTGIKARVEELSPLAAQRISELKRVHLTWDGVSMAVFGNKSMASSLAQVYKGTRKATPEIIVALGLGGMALDKHKLPRPASRRGDGIRVYLTREDAAIVAGKLAESDETMEVRERINKLLGRKERNGE